MDALDTSHRDRVNKAILFEKPDRTPRDFAAVPEIWNQLGSYFGIQDRHEILKRLDVDCRIVSYDSFCQHPSFDFPSPRFLTFYPGWPKNTESVKKLKSLSVKLQMNSAINPIKLPGRFG